MKVAILLCGQPRHVLKTSDNIINNIIKVYNADVFLHCWYADDDLYMTKGTSHNRGVCNIQKHIDKQLLDIYKPVKYCIEPQKFKNFKNYDINYFDMNYSHIIFNSSFNKFNNSLTKEQVKLNYIKWTHISNLYSIFKCNMLKEEYSIENNILYDCVIKLRFDQNIPHKIFLEKCDMNKLWALGYSSPDGHITDRINWGSNEIMNIYSSLFLHLKYFNNTNGFYKKEQRLPVRLFDTSNGLLGIEHLIRDQMKLYNIPIGYLNKIQNLTGNWNILDHTIQGKEAEIENKKIKENNSKN